MATEIHRKKNSTQNGQSSPKLGKHHMPTEIHRETISTRNGQSSPKLGTHHMPNRPYPNAKHRGIPNLNGVHMHHHLRQYQRQHVHMRICATQILTSFSSTRRVHTFHSKIDQLGSVYPVPQPPHLEMRIAV